MIIFLSKGNYIIKKQFFVLEGGDGAGKTTQIERLKKHFGNQLVTTREPGGCPRAEKIRAELFAHAEWSARKQFDEFWRARAYHFEDTIIPALAEGKMVISDRLDSSTWAYQIPENNDPELIEVFWEKRRDVMGVTEPNQYIYLNVSVEIGLTRKAKQQNVELNHFDNASVENQRRRQKGYEEFLRFVPHVIIDASKSEDEVFAEILAILER